MQDYLESLRTAASEGDAFTGNIVHLIEETQEKFFEDLCHTANVEDSSQLTSEKLMKLNKSQLSGYLETICCLFDKFAVRQIRHLSCEKEDLELFKSDVESKLNSLKEEKTADQKTIIELQHKLIDSQEQQLQSVKTTIQTEMKSYSTVLRESSIETEKKVTAAIKKVAVKQEDVRSNNLVVFGVKEEQEGTLTQNVLDILEHLDEKPQISNCCQVGKQKEGSDRPIKFTVRSPEMVYQILKKTPLLKSVEGYNSIYISPDRSVEQQIAHRTLVEELKKKRRAEPDKIFVIRNYKIVSLTKDMVT